MLVDSIQDILENARGAMIAKSFISTGKKTGHKVRGHDLGGIMVKVNRAIKKVAEVEQFSDRFNCQRGGKIRIK